MACQQQPERRTMMDWTDCQILPHGEHVYTRETGEATAVESDTFEQ